MLVKNSATNFDTLWAAVHDIPAGGAASYVLAKNTTTDFDVGWSRAAILQESLFYNNAGFGSTNNTAFLVISGSNCTINKLFAGTYLRCEFGASGWMVGVAGQIRIGVAPNGTVGDVRDVGGFWFNELNSHRAFTGIYQATGLPVGSYPCSWWLRITVSGQTFNSDNSDTFWAKVWEVWP